MQDRKTIAAGLMGQSAGQPRLADPGGAGHIVPTFRNPPRFTIVGAICSGRVSRFYAECVMKTAIG